MRDPKNAGTTMSAAIRVNGMLKRMHHFANLSNEGKNLRCAVRCSSFSESRTITGRRNSTERKLNTMPFASTTPISAPMRNAIAQRERNPKNVVAADEAMTPEALCMPASAAS